MEGIVFEEHLANASISCRIVFHQIGTHLDGHTLVTILAIVMMNLARRKEEDCAWTHFILKEIDRVMAFSFLKPDDLVERMYMSHAIVNLAGGKLL